MTELDPANTIHWHSPNDEPSTLSPIPKCCTAVVGWLLASHDERADQHTHRELDTFTHRVIRDLNDFADTIGTIPGLDGHVREHMVTVVQQCATRVQAVRR